MPTISIYITTEDYGKLIKLQEKKKLNNLSAIFKEAIDLYFQKTGNN